MFHKGRKEDKKEIFLQLISSTRYGLKSKAGKQEEAMLNTKNIISACHLNQTKSLAFSKRSSP